MIYSIRFKLFAVFVTLLIIFQLIFLLTNSYFLDDIFVWGNKRIMTKIYSDFKQRTTAETDQEALIHELNNDFDGNIAIIDLELKTITSTYNRFSRIRLQRILPNIQEMLNKAEIRTTDQDVFSFVSPQENVRSKTIVLVGKLPGNKLFIIEKPFGIIYESSLIAERFIIISGLGTLIIGSIIVFFLSGRLAKPISSINKVAMEIANLNFEDKVDIKTNDEIGDLGKSINRISDKLSGTLTELWEANEKLRKDIEKERSMEKMRRRFVSSVSHELKTPISLIQGYADGLKFNIAKSPEDMQYYCNVIIDESEKMSCLIKDLLDLSSYESGTFTITKAHFDFSDLIRDNIEKHRKVISEKNIRLETDISEVCDIYADKLRVEQVISNFLSNAERHVDENGNIKVSLTKHGAAARLSIYNSGSLIAPSEMDNIWTSFYKIDSRESKPNEGTGLGLAIVKAIIELHCGTCGVLNMDDGVEFWIELPCHHKTIT